MGVCQSNMNKISDEADASTPKYNQVYSNSKTNSVYTGNDTEKRTNSKTWKSIEEENTSQYTIIRLSESSPSTTNSDSSPISITLNESKKLLYSMDSNELAIIIKYILENEALFEKYKDESEDVYNAFIDYGIKGNMVIKLRRPQFANELPWIKKVITSKLYTYLTGLDDEQIEIILNKIHIPSIPNDENIKKEEEKYMNMELPPYLSQIDIIKSNKDNLRMYNKNEFAIFVYILCVINKYDAVNIDILLKGLVNMNINGKEFMEINRFEFCRKLKELQIKGAVASKLYKLIMTNNDNISEYFNKNNVSLHIVNKKLTAMELAEIGIWDFQTAAYTMLYAMNDAMKRNVVNGLILVEHYQCKHDLEVYLKENVRNKSVNILVDILWNDYVMDKENKIEIIKQFDRKQVLKYFIVLYMHHIKVVMMKNELDNDKCIRLQRKGVCNIFIEECGFTIGIATNIVDKIFERIHG